MSSYNINLKNIPWAKVNAADGEIDFACLVNFYGGGSGKKEHNPENTKEEPEVDKSVMDKMNARRGTGDSTKADSGGGDADKRVVSKDVDSGPINTDRGA